jgi:TetR/AcrR family transcriptional regulator, mexJK operon transcriptional repressor
MTQRTSSGTSRIGRPTETRAAQIRHRILAVATDEFLEHGFNGASVDRIAKMSGTGKPTIYRHFGDKQRLFETVCRSASKGLRSELRALVDDPRPPDTVLLEYARILYDIDAHRVMASLGRIALFEGLHSPDVSEAVFRQADETYAPIEEYLARQSRAGRLEIDNPRIAAAQFAALVAGGIRSFALTRATRARERVRWLEAAVALFMRATAPGRAAWNRPFRTL